MNISKSSFGSIEGETKINLRKLNLASLKKYFIEYCPELLNSELKKMFLSKESINEQYCIISSSKSAGKKLFDRDIILPEDHRLLSMILIHKHENTFEIEEKGSNFLNPYLNRYYRQLYGMPQSEYYIKILEHQAQTIRPFIDSLYDVYGQIIQEGNNFSASIIAKINQLKQASYVARKAQQFLNQQRIKKKILIENENSQSSSKQQMKETFLKKDMPIEPQQVVQESPKPVIIKPEEQKKQFKNYYQEYRHFKIIHTQKEMKKSKSKWQNVIQGYIEIQKQNK